MKTISWKNVPGSITRWVELTETVTRGKAWIYDLDSGEAILESVTVPPRVADALRCEPGIHGDLTISFKSSGFNEPPSWECDGGRIEDRELVSVEFESYEPDPMRTCDEPPLTKVRFTLSREDALAAFDHYDEQVKAAELCEQ